MRNYLPDMIETLQMAPKLPVLNLLINVGRPKQKKARLQGKACR
jgi:hypothetical protein